MHYYWDLSCRGCVSPLLISLLASFAFLQSTWISSIRTYCVSHFSIMVITNESPTGPFQNETLTAGSQEEKKIPPEKVTSSAVDIVSFCEDDKVTNNSSKADEKNIIHHSSILPSNNGSISGIEIAAKRILTGGPGRTLSDWMNNQSILSVRPLPSDHSQSFSTFGIPKSFQYNTMLSYPYAYRQHLPDTTPPIFQNTPLRRGKWTIVSNTCLVLVGLFANPFHLYSLKFFCPLL